MFKVGRKISRRNHYEIYPEFALSLTQVFLETSRYHQPEEDQMRMKVMMKKMMVKRIKKMTNKKMTRTRRHYSDEVLGQYQGHVERYNFEKIAKMTCRIKIMYFDFESNSCHIIVTSSEDIIFMNKDINCMNNTIIQYNDSISVFSRCK